ncbi:MAG: hypothetical protein DRO95_05610, partial [Candidatus Altiarchaeales archaeon]
MQDWATANIYLENADGNTIANVTSSSSPGDSIWLDSSNSNTLTNITANSNDWPGIHLDSSSSNTLTNITANSNAFGFYLESSNSNTLTDITANSNGIYGIYLGYSSSNTLSNITANSNTFGFYLDDSSSNTFTNCTAQENDYLDFYIYASSDSECNNKIENITGSNNLPILYYNSSVTLSNEVLSELVLCNADNSNIENITINASQTKKNNEVYILRTDDSNFTNIVSSDNFNGISILSSSSNTFTNCTANSNSQYGIEISGSSSSNTFTNCTANSNYDSFHISQSSSNTLTNCTASNSQYGIRMSYNSDNNTIANSTISGNTDAGLYLDEDGSDDPEYNKIYNCLFNNSVNVKIDSGIAEENYFNTTKRLGTRIYSDGNYIGGNYYTNSTGNGYSDTCTDSDHDGFCDDPLNLSYGTSVAWDYLPLSDEYSTGNYISNCTDITSPGVYYLTADIINSSQSQCINISANNVTLDCQGHLIDGDDNLGKYGIYINRTSSVIANITIRNCNIEDWNIGIFINKANTNTLENLDVSSNFLGIYISNSNYNNLSNIITDNSSYHGIVLNIANYNNFSNVTSNNNTQDGISILGNSSCNTFVNVSVQFNSDDGIYMGDSNSNYFFGVISRSNKNGFWINAASLNTIRNSRIESNTQYGISIDQAGNNGPNLIYNNLFNNTNNIYFTGTTYTNSWNITRQLSTNIYTGYYTYIGGNFYAKPNGTGYSEVCNDTDRDGFCDEPYELPDGNDSVENTDYLPLSSTPTKAIFSCSNLNESGTTYFLIQDIINSSQSYCINISANNVTLDCQGHLIDGDDNARYGIYINRSSQQTTNITIRNCVVQDWATANIYLENADGNTIANVTSNSSPDYGIYFDHSGSNALTNITANSNFFGILLISSSSNTFQDIAVSSNGGDGILLYLSSSNTLSNITANSNGWDGIVIYLSSSNTLSNITANSNGYGIYLISSSSNTLTNITANSNGEGGIVLYSSSSNTVTNSTLRENSVDFYIFASSDSECNNKIENITGSNNLPILYYNSSVTLSDMQLSELILCNADYSNIDNITINGSQSLDNNMLHLMRTDHSNISNIYSSNNYYGILLDSSSSNTLINITANSNDYDGVSLYSSSSNTLTSIMANSNDGNGILISWNSDNNIIANSTISNNTDAGLYLEEFDPDYPEYNKIYNCLFNNSVNVKIDSGIPNPNYFNTTKQLGTRIYSAGNYIGGNYWTNPSGTGYSDICNDTDHDGFCDEPLNLSSGTSVAWDYLPLSDEYDSFTITLNNPPNLAQTLETKPNFTFTAQSLYHQNFSCTLYVDDTAYGTNSSVQNNTETTITANDTLSLGDHSWYIKCGQNRSETRTIGIGANLTRCAVLIDADTQYNLTQNVSSSGTCMQINANNITLDCRGYKIKYSTSFVGYGVDDSGGYDYTTIKNCNIVQGSTSNDSYGIYFNGVTNGLIKNNNITTTSDELGIGIRIESSSTNTLANNKIITSGQYSYGIYLKFSSGSNVLANNTISTSGYSGYGILLYSSSTNILANNTISTSGYSGDGIYLYISSNSNTISNNTISTSNTWSYGILLYTSSNSNTLSSNTISTSGTNAYGIYLYDSDNNNITSCSVNASYSNTGDLCLRDADNIKVIDTNYTDIYYYDSTSDLWRYWYLDVYVNDTTGNPVNQSNVTAWNVNNEQQFSELTQANGYITRKTLLEYSQFNCPTGYHSTAKFGCETFYTNYTINATKTGYT